MRSRGNVGKTLSELQRVAVLGFYLREIGSPKTILGISQRAQSRPQERRSLISESSCASIGFTSLPG